MSSIDTMFRTLHKQQQKGLFPFVVAGYPDIQTTEALLFTLQENGADLVEIGVPFSDPVADGPVIQEASYYALNHGVTLNAIFAMVKRSRKRVHIPLVLMTYYNPLLQYGLDQVVRKAADAGVSGFIIPDLPIDAATVFKKNLEKNGLDLIVLMSINTSLKRTAYLAKKSSGFIYLVSHLGITGVADFSMEPLRKKRALIKKYTETPVAIGFGISNAEQAQRVSSVGDAVIIGSSLVRMMKGKKRDALLRDAGGFIKTIKRNLVKRDSN